MEQEQMEQLKQWLRKYKGILIRVFLYGPGILSAVQIVNLSFQNYVSEWFFGYCTPYALILCGSCIAAAIYESRHGH